MANSPEIKCDRVLRLTISIVLWIFGAVMAPILASSVNFPLNTIGRGLLAAVFVVVSTIGIWFATREMVEIEVLKNWNVKGVTFKQIDENTNIKRYSFFMVTAWLLALTAACFIASNPSDGWSNWFGGAYLVTAAIVFALLLFWRIRLSKQLAFREEELRE
jgi:hypothetical protein